MESQLSNRKCINVISFNRLKYRIIYVNFFNHKRFVLKETLKNFIKMISFTVASKLYI